MKKGIIVLILAATALLVLFLTTDPQKLPSILLILPFLVIFGLVFYLVKWFSVKRGISAKRAVRLALLCAALPTLLLVLQSIGQLTIRDVATTALLFFLSYFYISRTVAARE